MRKVIKGRKYDTDTACRVGHWDNGKYHNDFRWQEETLYLKSTGEFFLHGEGGGLSPYAHYYGNGRGEGEKIIPMTIVEAQRWVEDHACYEVYVDLFGEPEE